MKTIPNFGILASISWNSNKWQDHPSKQDLKASKYDFVKENAHMHESLNFGHEKYPLEEDGTFIAYTHMKVKKKADFDYGNFEEQALKGMY